jgi:hypothetical protein
MRAERETRDRVSEVAKSHQLAARLQPHHTVMAINGLPSVSDDRISKRQRPHRQKGVITTLVGQDCDIVV